MIKITIISVGKLKEKHLKDGIKEYSKRLQSYCKLSFIEVADEPISKTELTSSEEKMIKEAEAERIKKHIKPKQYVISLDLKGNQLSSEELSKHIEQRALSGESDIVFIIGGSIGISEEILKNSDYRLCFSKMTFPHQLMRLILLEQIYRSFKISKGETYHK